MKIYKKMKNLGLKFAKRFWTFINVQNSKGPSGLCKKSEKSCCDHYGLLLFLRNFNL